MSPLLVVIFFILGVLGLSFMTFMVLILIQSYDDFEPECLIGESYNYEEGD